MECVYMCRVVWSGVAYLGACRGRPVPGRYRRGVAGSEAGTAVCRSRNYTGRYEREDSKSNGGVERGYTGRFTVGLLLGPGFRGTHIISIDWLPMAEGRCKERLDVSRHHTSCSNLCALHGIL